MTADFNVHADVGPGRRAVVAVSGEIDAYTAPRLSEQIVALAQEGVEQVVIDLREVEFIDSSGISALVGGAKLLRRRDGGLSLRSPTGPVRRILDIAGLARLLPIVPDGD